MRRADRLFEIIQRLRRRRVVTAGSLAEEFKVSERTIYRDIRDLTASKVPIEGAAGIGYSLRKVRSWKPPSRRGRVEFVARNRRRVDAIGRAFLGCLA